MSPRRDNSPAIGRRNFLKGATLAGTAAAITAAPAANAVPTAPAAKLKAALPGPRQIAADTQAPVKDPATQTSSGGDFMVDVFKTLDIDYLAMNCASSFRGLHEAVLNYNNNKPEILTCPHEEIAVAMGHGYAKIEGKPMAMICHGVVGLQHATMAMYNAWCDRVPVYVMGGNIVEADKRMPGAEWVHSAIDIGALTRDFTKWDDQPTSLQHFAESAVRAYKVAMTPPMGPVLLSLDAELQENPIREAESLRIPKLGRVMAPVGDSGAIADAAKMLVGRREPGDRLRPPRAHAGRHGAARRARRDAAMRGDRQCRADELPDAASAQHELPPRPGAGAGRRDPGAGDERSLGRAQPVQRPHRAQLPAGHQEGRQGHHARHARPLSQGQLPGLRALPGRRSLHRGRRRGVAAVADRAGQDASSTSGRKAAYEARGKKLAAARLAMIEQAKSDATLGWDASPITTARMCAEVYAQIKDEDWSLVGNAIRNVWPHRLWDIKKPYQWNGGSGGAGIGYNLPASIGAALANKRHGRLTVAFGGDGDFNFVPGALWTAAHHKIPLLYVVHNNRAYHQEVMYLQAMAARHGRGIDNAHIGTTLTDPNIDYATVARGFGVAWRRADHRPEGPRARDQARARGGQARRARADRCRHRSALRERCHEKSSFDRRGDRCRRCLSVAFGTPGARAGCAAGRRRQRQARLSGGRAACIATAAPGRAAR